jgi:hypothetical protein
MKYYRSQIIIFIIRILKILGLKAYNNNNNSNILTYRSITLKHYKLKIFIGKTS